MRLDEWLCEEKPSRLKIIWSGRFPLATAAQISTNRVEITLKKKKKHWLLSKPHHPSGCQRHSRSFQIFFFREWKYWQFHCVETRTGLKTIQRLGVLRNCLGRLWRLNDDAKLTKHSFGVSDWNRSVKVRRQCDFLQEWVNMWTLGQQL